MHSQNKKNHKTKLKNICIQWILFTQEWKKIVHNISISHWGNQWWWRLCINVILFIYCRLFWWVRINVDQKCNINMNRKWSVLFSLFELAIASNSRFSVAILQCWYDMFVNNLCVLYPTHYKLLTVWSIFLRCISWL